MLTIEQDINEAIAQQHALFKPFLSGLKGQQEQLFTAGYVKKIRKIYLAGCGDSLFAALGSRLFFQQVTGIDVEPVDSMEFSRYLAPHMPPDTVVFGISNSGRVSRTVEALLQARRYGAPTVAMTGYAERNAAAGADAILVGALPNIRSMLDSVSARVESSQQDHLFSDMSRPGVMERLPAAMGLPPGIDLLLFMLGAYLSSLAHLFTAALQIGLARGHITDTQAEKHRETLMKAVEIIVRSTYNTLDPVQQLAERFRDKDAFLFLGAGPSYASASLSAAKLFEQPHLNGVAQYLEEWAHLQFFFTRPDGVPVFVIVPPGDSRDRAVEQIDGIKKLGGTVVVICDSEDQELADMADASLKIDGRLPEAFSSWTYGVPEQLFAVSMLNMNGIPVIPEPYSFKQMMQVNFQQIYNSAIRDS